jgi:PAP2 superfamily
MRLALLIGGLLASSAACADVITDWDEKAVGAGYTARQGPPPHSRIVAMVHLAMFEAVNSIDGRYRPYRARLAAEPGASREAAAAAAAHYVLARVYPDQAKDTDQALRASLAAVAEPDARAKGVRLGERAGATILAERANDGAAGPDTYRPHTSPGKYVPTVLPAASRWGGVRPYALKSGDQFRPAAPYALSSREWANDYNEVKRLGAKTGSARTAEQTDVARFWELTGPASYNPLARQLALAKKLDVTDCARMFALVSMAAADALISVFDAKYTYNFWRPVTAVRNGDLSGNDAVERDAAWEPYIPTPMHPEYPCAHCISQAAVAGVFEHFFGDAIPPVKLTSTTAPGVTRTFSKLSDYVNEVINARIYDGVHYRTSGDVGADMGRKIALYTVRNHLLPEN